MSRRATDLVLTWTCWFLALVAGAVLLVIALFVAAEALLLLRAEGPLRVFTDGAWRPAEGLFDLTPMLAGTLLVAGGALLLAVPLGVLSAVFARQYAPAPLGGLYRRILALMAGIPSVVYGLWGLVVVVPLIVRLQPPGSSLLAGILVLSLMLLPMIALTTHAAPAEVPPAHLRAAAALGLSRWGTVRSVLLPAARTGIVTGVILAVGRTVGETMAVSLVFFFLLGDVVRHGIGALSLEFVLAEPRGAGREGGIGPVLISTGLILGVCLAVAVPLVLGMGRALAETAALLFTSGYGLRSPTSLLDSGRALSLHIYDLAMNVPGGETNAYGTALVLVLLLVAVNALALWLGEWWLGGRIAEVKT